MTSKKDAIAKNLAANSDLLSRRRNQIERASHFPEYALAARLMGVTTTHLSFEELVETCNQIIAAAENYALIAETGVESGVWVEIKIDDDLIKGEVTSINMGGLVVVKPRSEEPVTIIPSKWDSVKVFAAV